MPMPSRFLNAARFVVLTAGMLFSLTPAWAGSGEPWATIRESLFEKRELIADQSVKLFAPKRAEDASLVPIRVYISGERIAHAQRLILVVDNNPAPVAAEIRFGDLYRKGDIGDRSIKTRIRLESMSKVRAILELNDGSLFEASQFVAGSGGCTTTALKDSEAAKRGLGKLRVNIAEEPTRGDLWHELQLQIRHPNFSGMQIDPSTNAHVPAEFVESIDVRIGQQHLVTIESGVAISENPNFRLSFAKEQPQQATVIARDTSKRTFRTTTTP